MLRVVTRVFVKALEFSDYCWLALTTVKSHCYSVFTFKSFKPQMDLDQHLYLNMSLHCYHYFTLGLDFEHGLNYIQSLISTII